MENLDNKARILLGIVFLSLVTLGILWSPKRTIFQQEHTYQTASIINWNLLSRNNEPIHVDSTVLWVAPVAANQLVNPYKMDNAKTNEGKKLFSTMCIVCHGNKGKGDGIGGTSLNPRPANLTSHKVQAQSDGAIFWKLTNGNPPMASYKTILTEEQRWSLVNYIRRLGNVVVAKN